MAFETKTIIVVEDDPDTAEMFTEMMRISGYNVIKSYGGASAIALIASEKPAAVVLDLVLPDLSGLEVLKLIRNDRSLAQIPVIIVSGKSLPSDIKHGMDAGATIYMTKPVAFLELKAAVESAIQTNENKNIHPSVGGLNSMTESTVIRTFIAIELPPEIQKNIDQVSQDLRLQLKGMPVRWVATGNIHLTLKFLGDVSLAQLESIKKLLSTITKGHIAFNISVRGLGVFPKPQRPKVIWVGVDAPSDLIDIQKEIEKIVSQIGFPPETRPFSPHLTLGRITQPVNPILVNRISEYLDSSRGVNLGSFEVKSIQLFRSDLKPGGSFYTRLFSGLLSNNNF